MEEPVQGAVQASIPRLVRSFARRDLRCPCGKMFFKARLVEGSFLKEGADIEIECRYCKRTVVFQR